MCIAMAYPPWGTQYSAFEREIIPNNRPPSTFVHNDLHDENVMLDAWWPGGTEHRLTPTLKAS